MRYGKSLLRDTLPAKRAYYDWIARRTDQDDRKVMFGWRASRERCPLGELSARKSHKRTDRHLEFCQAAGAT